MLTTMDVSANIRVHDAWDNNLRYYENLKHYKSYDEAFFKNHMDRIYNLTTTLKLIMQIDIEN